MNFITIDGSFGEGGGQILRTAIAASSISGKPVKVVNIRSKRQNPGLRPQHMIAIKALSQICNAKVEGLKISSKEITYIPSYIKGGNYFFDIGTAGSVTLVLQAILPVLIFAEKSSKILLKGGTAVPKAPTISYFSKVFLFHLKKIGVEIQVKILKHGFYPKGGGVIQINVYPSHQLKNINLESFNGVDFISCEAYSEGLPAHVIEREINECKKILANKVTEDKLIIEKRMLTLQESKGNIGNYFCIFSKSKNDTVIGYDGIGLKGIPAEKVALIPTRNLVENIYYSKAATDYFAGDQLLIWMSISKGFSKITTHKYTMHSYTTLHILKEIFNIDYYVQGSLGESATIKIYSKS